MWVFLDIAPMCSFPTGCSAKQVMGCTTGAEQGRCEVGREICRGRKELVGNTDG